MFLPIGDEPHPRGAAPTTYALMAANIAVYALITLPESGRLPNLDDPSTVAALAQMADATGDMFETMAQHVSSYDLFVFTHGFRPAAASLTTLLSSLFLHSGFLHLAGNMLFLWIFGRAVDVHMGRALFLAVYAGTGMAASLFFALFSRHPQMPLIGASGAVSGVLGCYYVWFPQHRVKTFVMLIWLVDVVYIPVRWVLGFYLLVENLLPFLRDSGKSGIAYGAHIGGFASGWVFAVLWQRRQQLRAQGAAWEPRPQPQPREEVLKPTAVIVPPLSEPIAAERFGDAWGRYQALTPAQQREVPVDEVLTLTRWLTEQGRPLEALRMLQQTVATRQPLRERTPEAQILAVQHLAATHMAAGLLQRDVLHNLNAAYQHFLYVLDLSTDPRQTAEARQAVRQLEQQLK